MYSQLPNVSCILNKTGQHLIRFYSSEIFEEISLMNKYYILGLIEDPISSENIKSGILRLDNIFSIVYSKSKDISIISYFKINISEEELFHFIETNEFLLLQIENWIEENKESDMEKDLYSHLGKKIDDLLGMESLFSNNYIINDKMILKNGMKIKKLKKMLSEIKLTNNELYLFQTISSYVNSYIQTQELFSKIEKRNFNFLTNEIRKFCEIERWLTT